MSGINVWWKERPRERFWLGITARDDEGELLAVPLGSRHDIPSWTHPLIGHVREGDVVFHYDESRRAITAWSTSSGRCSKRHLPWASPLADGESRPSSPRMLPSWSVALSGPTPLPIVVPLEYIAQVQREMYPALRSFEDEVGSPLYYPFTMDSPSDIRLLPGYVFKLPALFLEYFPVMARTPVRAIVRRGARRRSSPRSEPRPGPALLPEPHMPAGADIEWLGAETTETT